MKKLTIIDIGGIMDDKSFSKKQKVEKE